MEDLETWQKFVGDVGTHTHTHTHTPCVRACMRFTYFCLFPDTRPSPVTQRPVREMAITPVGQVLREMDEFSDSRSQNL